MNLISFQNDILRMFSFSLFISVRLIDRMHVLRMQKIIAPI